MFCVTPVANSCARCRLHSVCPGGMVVKVPGTAEKDTVCGLPSPEAGPGCTSSEDCSTPASSSMAQATSTLTSPTTAKARTTLLRGGSPVTVRAASGLVRAPKAPSSVGEPSPNPGLSLLQQPCLQGSADCKKQCGPEYYLDGASRCTACVSCAQDDLVEKAPCSWNSSRVCECRPGMFCVTPVANSCARCIARLNCAPGTVVKRQGMTKRDTTLEPSPPGTHPDCSTPENSEAPASTAPSLQPLLDSHTISTVSFSSTRKPILDPGPVLFWVVLVLLVVVGFSSFLLCYWRACRKRIGQKLHLCYPAQTFRPKLERMDSGPRRNPTQPRSVSVSEPGAEVLSVVRPPSLEMCAHVGASCPESLPLLDDSPATGPLAPRDPPEPRVSTEHTNNRIEKIYIMKADTVIVGTVKTEVPEGRALAGPTGPELEAELEVDHVPHYPEQETEPPLGSCDVMFSVEEEGKQDPQPSTASGK
ncbi:tumor necrosis factor receptor superfamily member 8 [Castor canadensis]|uniref:Tumor necrosis factor receptor superfamily member 8 n=1 Tax=Castor canadensis TaxID=51338 RepID=A0AC58N706_CASCN